MPADSDSTKSDVRRLFDKLDSINQTVTRIEANCGPCKQMVSENHHAIRGNGEGLLTRTTVLEGTVKTLAADAKSTSGEPKLTVKQWIGILLALAGTGFLGSFSGNFASTSPPPQQQIEAHGD